MIPAGNFSDCVRFRLKKVQMMKQIPAYIMTIIAVCLIMGCPLPDQELQVWWTNASPLNFNTYGVNHANADGTNNIQRVTDTLLNVLLNSSGSRCNTPDGVIVDLENGRVYWTNMNYLSGNDEAAKGGSIAGANLDGSGVEFVVPPGKGVVRPKQITMDFDSQKLYWSDREGRKVWRSNTDGTELEALVDWSDESVHEHQFVGIAVDSARQVFYWTDRVAGTIHCASMDVIGIGKNDTQLYTTIATGMDAPIDLALDPSGDILFFTERGKGDELTGCTTCGSVRSIETNTYSSQADSTLLVEGIEGIGVDYDEVTDRVFYSDYNGIFGSVNTDGTDHKVIHQGAGGATTGIDLVRIGTL
jgi:sugar lactone lactonase YvrE